MATKTELEERIEDLEASMEHVLHSLKTAHSIMFFMQKDGRRMKKKIKELENERSVDSLSGRD